MPVSITFTDDEYEALIGALAMAHPNKNINKTKNDLIKQMPSDIRKKVDPLRSVIDNFNAIQKTTDADTFIKQLIVIDTAKTASKYDSHKFAAFMAGVLGKNKALAVDVRDAVFGKSSAYKFPGQLVKHILAEALIDAGFSNEDLFKEYSKKVFGNYPGDQTVKIFGKILKSDPAKCRDINLLTRMGNQNNRTVAIMAVSIADEKILPYLVGITNKQARDVLKKRMTV